MAWTISTFVDNKAPMSIGWNSRLVPDDVPQQNVCYMENICLPPTRNDVIVKTMKISPNVAKECGQYRALYTMI